MRPDLLTRAEPPTAFVCASDSLALGALQASGGRTAAVIGFDDTPVAQAIGLTSVSQPLPDAAARCIDLLTDHLDGDPVGTTPGAAPAVARDPHHRVNPSTPSSRSTT